MATTAQSLVSVNQSGPGYLIANTLSGQTVKITGNRNWRNNNPGNLKATSFTRNQQGYIGEDNSGFGIFDTYENGSNAQRKLLFGPTYINLSIDQAITKYAPPSENNTEAYINSITKSLGVDRNTPLSSLSQTQQEQLIKSIEQVEGYIPGNVEVLSQQPVVPSVAPSETPSEDSVTDVATSPTTNVTAPRPLPNRLKAYPSYTYGLSLHMMTPEKYNNMVLNRSYVPENIIVASAGRHSNTFPRNEFFTEDFYFDDFQLETVITTAETNRETNAINMSFTLIEPYGFTFIDRLLKAATKLNIKNYLDAPYMLQIDFFAINDDGTPQGSIPELRKNIPIRFLKMDTNISAKGAEYKFDAVPYGHTAYNVTTATTPANFEITASTVEEFFISKEGTNEDTIIQAASFINQRERDQTATLTPTLPDGTIAPRPNWEKSTAADFTIPKYFRAKSYGTAINSYYQALKQNNKTQMNDVFRFEFAPDPETGEDVIGKSKFIDRLRNTPRNTPIAAGSTETEDIIIKKRSDVGASTKLYDPSYAIFQINYGTTIIRLLEYIIRNSDYILNQIVIPDGLTAEEYAAKKEELKDKPLNWFKIVPTIRLLGFDEITNVWSREITYTVKPYKIYNVRSDIGPQGTAKYPVKFYNYIYTGENDDVYDFDLTFNMLYFISATAYRDNMTELNKTGAATVVNYQNQNAPNYTGANPPGPNSVAPVSTKPQVQNSLAVATGGAKTAREIAAADLSDNLLNRSEADLIHLKLKILGDPDFIKQDDLFISPVKLISDNIIPQTKGDPRLLEGTGSLNMDDSGLYVQVTFKTARDYEDSTGLMKKEDAMINVFSGMYLVVSVTNQFSGGIFTQELSMVRLSRQMAFDYVNTPALNENRNENGATIGPMGTPTKIDIQTESVPGGYDPTSITEELSQQVGQNQPTAIANNNVPPILTSEVQELRQVNQTAPTVPISTQTQPQATLAPDFTPVSVRGNQVPGRTAT